MCFVCKWEIQNDASPLQTERKRPASHFTLRRCQRQAGGRKLRRKSLFVDCRPAKYFSSEWEWNYKFFESRQATTCFSWGCIKWKPICRFKWMTAPLPGSKDKVCVRWGFNWATIAKRVVRRKIKNVWISYKKPNALCWFVISFIY